MAKPIQLKFSVGGGTVVVGRDQWLLWLPRDDLDVRVQVRYRDGVPFAGAVTVQHFGSDGAVTGSSLRAVPMGRLDQALRDPMIRHALNSQSPSLPDVSPGHLSPTQAAEVLAAVEGATAWEEPLDLRLEQPGRGAPKDEFLLQVVNLYARARKRSARAAADIAEANEVATSTVHGWLKEAKKRGLEQA